jgi:hypothetical protein
MFVCFLNNAKSFLTLDTMKVFVVIRLHRTEQWAGQITGEKLAYAPMFQYWFLSAQ